MNWSRTIGLLALLVLAGCNAPDKKPQIDPAFEEEVRELVRCSGKHCGFDVVAPYQEKLLQHGEKAFPVYEAILADPDTDKRMVSLTCAAIERIKVDRRRFVPLLVKRITAADAMYVPEWQFRAQVDSREEQARHRNRQESHTRDELANLLVEIGDERDAAALAPYLLHQSESLRRVAARVLCAFGNHSHLDAMNLLLKHGLHGPGADELRDLVLCRDQLAKRLKEHPVPRTLTN